MLGHIISDPRGVPVGTVVDTYPFDGGGEVELVLVRMPRLGERRLVPADSLHLDITGLRTPYAYWQVEDSPALEEGRHFVEDALRARSYWLWEEPAGSLTARWPLSSGSSATVRRYPMVPSPTTTGS
jgi:hypothetical protein